MAVSPIPSVCPDDLYLSSLLDHLDRRPGEDGWDDDPALIRVESDPQSPGDFVVRTRDLEGLSPSAALLGYSAPPACVALGVVAGGWASSLDGDRADRRRVRVVVLLTRDGRTVGRTRVDGGATVDQAPDAGLVPDLLRRALGLPTPPPQHPVDELHALWWLEAVLAEGDRNGRTIGVRTVRALHPAARLLAHDGGIPPRTALGEIAAAYARIVSWSMLRRRAIDHDELAGLLTREEAAWFDEGSFARWLLGTAPPLEVLVARADRCVSPGAAKVIRETLAHLGLDATYD